MIKLLHLFSLLLFFSLVSGCKDVTGRKKYPDTDMYNFSHPKVLELPTDLDEISGIAYYAKDTSVFGISDENGDLYKIPLSRPAAFEYWGFGKNADYEDIVLKDSIFYILVSNGDIDRVSFRGAQTSTTKFDFFTDKKKKNEFETIYLNKDNEITLICKDCEDDDKEHLSTFIFNDTAEVHYREGPLLDMNSYVQKLGVKKHLKPSAAAINPITKDLYLLSSVMQVLLIYGPEGNLKEMVELNPEFYKQPEGLTFTPDGNLIISNEFANDGLPNLLLLKNKKH